MLFSYHYEYIRVYVFFNLSFKDRLTYIFVDTCMSSTKVQAVYVVYDLKWIQIKKQT